MSATVSEPAADVLEKWAAAGARISRVGTVDIRRSTLASPDAARLIAALNAELKATFPEPGATHFSLTGAQVEAGDGAFVVAYLDEVAVGCGAVRRLDAATAELKRMYVDPSVRRRGIGRALVEALEREAQRLGVTKVVLETGTRLAPATKLYEAMGYAPIPLFGEYLSSPKTSLCFGKLLNSEIDRDDFVDID
jgi:putative acetyltransferase